MVVTIAESEEGRARATVEDWVLVVYQRGIMIDVGKSHWDLFIGQPLGESIRLTYGPHNSIHPRLHPSLSSIVFASDRDGDYELYAMSLADATLSQLTDNGWVDTLPAWSPDGQRIAYVSYAHGNADLFLMQADGSDVLQITSTPADDLYPAWSPDGAQLLWVQSNGAERSLWTMNADGSDPRMLAGPLSLLQRPLWSSDGTLIALSFDATGDGYSDVAITRPDGTDLQALHWSIHQQNYVVSSWYPSRLGDISINQFEPEVKRLLSTTSAQTPNPDSIDLGSADMGLFEFCCQLTSLSIGHQSLGAYPDARSADTRPPASRLKPLPPFTRATGFSLNWDAVDYGVSGLGA